MTTFFGFIIGLGLLVIVHEWGHYIVAKKCGIRVDIFSVGFGPRLFSVHFGGTEFRVSLIPLGGYVKIHGQDPWAEADGDEALAQEIARDPQSFHSKKYWQKLAVVFGGPAMNIVLCLLLMPAVFLIGRQQYKLMSEPPVVIDVVPDSPAAILNLKPGDKILSLAGSSTPQWKDLLTQVALAPGREVQISYERDGKPYTTTTKLGLNAKFKKATGINQETGYLGIEFYEFIDNEPVINDVMRDSPAEKAGLKSGDRVVSINGTPIKYWSRMTEMIQATGDAAAHGHPGSDVMAGDMTFGIMRDGVEQTLTLKPEFSTRTKSWVIGVSHKSDPSFMATERLGLGAAFLAGVRETWRITVVTAQAVKQLVTLQLNLGQVAGPVQIAKLTGQSLDSGYGDYLFILAYLSLNLGVMNLLPIPVLDGGHIFFMLIEIITRRPFSPRVRAVSTQVGLVMLLMLMAFVTLNDIDNVMNLGIIKKISGMF